MLSRLPKTDHSDIPLKPVINSVPIFALPSGTCLESWDEGEVGAINAQPRLQILAHFLCVGYNFDYFTRANNFKTCAKPEFSTFVLTTETSEKIYGASLVFLERFENEKLSDSMKRRLGLLAGNNEPIPGTETRPSYVSKAICLLSRHPFFDAFEAFLKSGFEILGSHRLN